MAQTIQAIYSHGPQHFCDYTPVADIPAGTIILAGAGPGTLVSIPSVPLPANKMGAVSIRGAYKIKKKAGDAFAYGAKVNWDNAAKLGQIAAGTHILGVCVRDAGANDDYVLTEINLTYTS